jgi:hypothetical protein
MPQAFIDLRLKPPQACTISFARARHYLAALLADDICKRIEAVAERLDAFDGQLGGDPVEGDADLFESL